MYLAAILFVFLAPSAVLGLSTTRYRELVNTVKQVISSNPLRTPGDENDGDTYGAIVRLVFHDAGTYDPNVAQSGAHGCLLYDCGVGNECQYNYPENNGLQLASALVLSLYEQYGLSSEDLSRADFLYLVGNAALERSIEEAGESVPRIGFRTGRTECEGFPLFDGALPDATIASRAETRRVFGRLGFNDAEAVTLLGAHTLGRCEIQNSGFELPWVNHPDKFDARYFDWVIGRQWQLRANNAGNEQWYRDNEFMMLNADLNFAFDLNNCNDSEDCARGPLYDLVESYADDDSLFIREFNTVWQRLSEKTDDTLVDLDGVVGPEEPQQHQEPVKEKRTSRWAYGAIGGSVLVVAGLVSYAKLRLRRSAAGVEEDDTSELEDGTSELEDGPTLLSEGDFINSSSQVAN